MKDISYDILELLEKYGSDPEGIQKALESEKAPEVLYALYPIRENLLEWYEWNPSGRLLQIGADYGALTGMLAEKLGEVSVWDVRDEDLEVVKRRCPEAENIRLMKRAFLEDLPESSFDYILIPEFRRDLMPEKGEEGIKALFAGLKKLLKPGGSLLAAGFNRIGLRTFAGAEPDQEAETLTWRLIREVSGECLEGTEPKIYYPVPDHRLPVAIYSDHRLPAKGELPNLSMIYDRPGYRYFNEEAGFDRLLQEGQFSQFADSYLVIWEKI